MDGVILSDGCASVYAPKTLRASMGAAVRIPVIEAECRCPGCHHPAARKRDHSPRCSCGQVPAAERGAGKLPRRRLRRHRQRGSGPRPMRPLPPAAARCAIPMTDRVESLNAGIAGSILLWHFREESL
ncbi:MAG: hypothetical protein ACLTOI_10140 [Faecalibacterium sp.]